MSNAEPPGLAVPTLARLVLDARERCTLDLTGVRVLTEAATGPYSVTPVLAALAGATVVAVTAATGYGTVAQVRSETLALADRLGVVERITVTDERSPQRFAEADAITNSGHLRPITGECADAIRPEAVLSLMFETWEIQAGRHDVDLETLRARGVQIAGTNERHPDIGVFDYLGPMAVAQLADAGVSAHLGTIGVLCDNPFREHLVAGLRTAGAHVATAPSVSGLLEHPELAPGIRLDALVVALRPSGESVLREHELDVLARRWPDLVLTQFWGDLDRPACRDAGLACWPGRAPRTGHMGVLPSRLGPEPIVRLQAGGLKVAQVLLTPEYRRTEHDLAYVDVLFDARRPNGVPAR